MPARPPIAWLPAEGSNSEDNNLVATLDVHHGEREALGKDTPGSEQVRRAHFREFRRKGNGALNRLKQAFA
jgi:hypothetical protein